MSQFALVWSTVALAVAGGLSIARVLRRGAVADRTVGLDMLVVVLASAVVLDAAANGTTVFLTVVTVVALLAFVATVTIARFIEPVRAERATRSDPEPRQSLDGEDDP